MARSKRSGVVRCYQIDATIDTESIMVKAGESMVKNTSSRSPVGSRGAYAKGWRHELRKGLRGRKSVVVFNETDYRLTHLLENGHATLKGRRTLPRPHIAPAYDDTVKQYIEDMKVIDIVVKTKEV